MSTNRYEAASSRPRPHPFFAAASLLVMLGCTAPAVAQDIDALVRALDAAGARERAMAACELGELGSTAVRRAMPRLLTLLADDAAVEGRLCRDGYGWNRGWHDDSSPGREAAIALEEIGSEALDPLIDVLGGGSPPARDNAALALGLIEDSRALPVLERRLQTDDQARVRERSAWALGMIEDSRAVETLARARSDDNEKVRSQVAWALGMIESPDGVESLGDLIRDDDAKVREQAAWALGMIESARGVEPLVAAVADGSPKVRSQVAWALGMIESPHGVDPLVRLLDDPEPSVREQAAWGLGMIEDAVAVDGLVRALANDVSASVREQAAWALGMIEDPRAAGPLSDALEDDDEDVRDQAIWALGMVVRNADIESIDTSELARRLRESLDDE
jgi:HEAT repeat protein